MDIVDVMLQLDNSDIEYENEYMKVSKVLTEIPNSGRNIVKRVQLVVWKSKNTDIPDIDIRNYVKNEDSYRKGLTFSISEARELLNTLKDFFDNYDKE